MPDYAAVVCVETPDGVVLVKDPTKPLPHFWKLPGGKSMRRETPEMCAARELREETGIILDPLDLMLHSKTERPRHTHFIFWCRLDTAPKINERGNEGEVVKIVSKIDLGMRLLEGLVLRSHAHVLNQYVSTS